MASELLDELIKQLTKSEEYLEFLPMIQLTLADGDILLKARFEDMRLEIDTKARIIRVGKPYEEESFISHLLEDELNDKIRTYYQEWTNERRHIL